MRPIDKLALGFVMLTLVLSVGTLAIAVDDLRLRPCWGDVEYSRIYTVGCPKFGTQTAVDLIYDDGSKWTQFFAHDQMVYDPTLRPNTVRAEPGCTWPYRDEIHFN